MSLHSVGYQPSQAQFMQHICMLVRNVFEMPTELQILVFVVEVCYDLSLKDFQEFSESFREAYISLDNN